MPNWCFNEIYATGDNGKNKTGEIVDLLRDEDGVFSFETVMPMPKELNIRWGTEGQKAAYQIYHDWTGRKQDAYLDSLDAIGEKSFVEMMRSAKRWNQISLSDAAYNPPLDIPSDGIETLRDLGNRILDNIKKYGYGSWYDWRRFTWGTKWDMSDVSYSGWTLEFTTPWCPPYGVIGKISEMLPELDIYLKYQVEGNGFGGIHYRAGKAYADMDLIAGEIPVLGADK